MKYLLLFALNFILLSDASTQRIYPISIKDIRLEETCEGKYINHRLKLVLDATAELLDYFEIQYMGSNVPGLKLLFHGQVIDEMSSFKLEKMEDLNSIYIRFKIDRTIKEPHFTLIQTKKEMKRESRISIDYGYFKINSKISAISISEACQDSVVLLFPFVATQTDIHLSVLKDGKYVDQKPFSFYCCYGGNGFKIPISLLTKFKVRTTGCHNYENTYEFETN